MRISNRSCQMAPYTQAQEFIIAAAYGKRKEHCFVHGEVKPAPSQSAYLGQRVCSLFKAGSCKYTCSKPKQRGLVSLQEYH